MTLGHSKKRAGVVAAALAGALSFAGAGYAADPDPDRGAGGDPFAVLESVPEAELSGVRGRGDIDIEEDIEQTLTFQNNTVNGATSGAITIQDDAFSELHGFQAIVINSGNNVAVQNSLTVNVVMY